MRRLAALAGAALAAAACTSPPPLPEGSFQLAELEESARYVVETDVIDIGAPEHRPALWSGWGPNESYPEGTFAWGSGEKSRLRFDVVEPRDRTLRLRGWSYPFGDSPPQEVKVDIAGREIGRRKLATNPGWVELELPGETLAVGENFLELRYERHAGGATPWAVGWDSLRLGEPRSGAPPRIDRGTGKIVLPARTAIEWTLELAGDSWLAWRSLTTTGGAQLAVSIVGEDDRREELPRGRARRLRLTAEGQPYRLHTISLRALGERGEVSLTGLRLHAADLAQAPAAHAPAAPAAVAQPAASTAPTNFVIYLIDTLRADHLGCYGYPRPTSPAIDAFAEKAVRFREARANSSWTRPAIATIFTGLYPITHQAQRTSDKLSSRFETLAERLHAAGWQTAMVTTNGNVARRFGFGQGFERFFYFAERLRRAETHTRSADAQRAALGWIDKRDPARPFFVFVHTADPHDPYTPAPEFRKRLAADVTDKSIGTRAFMAKLTDLPEAEAAAQRRALVALYDAEIAQNDDSFGRFVGELARRGLDRTTAVLLTADHGEEFFEHGGWKHGQTLYEEQLRIPLVLSLPGGRGAGTVVADPVEQIDIAPTLLELAGLPIPRELPGRSLAPLVEGRSRERAGHVFFAWLETHGRVLATALRADWKLIENRALRNPLATAPYELYSLGSDAEEKQDLALRRGLRRTWLQGQLRRGLTRFASLEPAEETALDPELRATLEALGYL